MANELPEEPTPTQVKLKPSPLVRAPRILLAISVIAVAGIALLLLYYALPANDDFVRATRPQELGWWGYVYGFVYKKWQGRWSSCGLESAVLPQLDITKYYWTLISGVLLVNVIGAFAVVRYLARSASKRAVLGMTLVLLTVLWSGLPSPAEAVYWFTGAVENVLVLSLAAMLLVFVCRTGELRDGRDPVLFAIPLGIFAFVIVGFHEVFGTMLWMALVAGTAVGFWRKLPNRFVWLTAMLAATAGLIVVVAAPGNSARFATEGGPHNRQFLYGLKIALSQAKFYPKWWLLDPKLIAATVWVVCCGYSPRRHQIIAEHGPEDRVTRGAASPNVGNHLLWICPLVWLAVVAFGFYFPSWVLGAAMPLRTLSGNYVVFVVGWLVNVYLWSRSLHKNDTPLPKSFFITGRLAELGLAVSLLVISTTPESDRTSWQFTGRFRDALVDLHYNITPWHDALEDRYEVLRRVHGGDGKVTPLPSGTRLLPAGEIVTPGPLIYTTSMKWYFHLKSFRVIPPPRTDPAARK